MRPATALPLSDVNGANASTRATVTPIKLVDREREIAQGRRLAILKQQDKAWWSDEKTKRREARDKAIEKPAYDRGYRTGYDVGYVNGTHWGIFVGIIAGGLSTAIVIALGPTLLRAIGGFFGLFL